jgi:DNA-binding transcriptional LysR family regulator
MAAPNLRQIEAFKTVVEAGSVSRAAEVLGVSQPAVSKLIAQFEYAVGFAVFDRVRGRLVVRAEGMQLYEEVDRVFAGVRQIAEAARQIRSSHQRQLAIGVMPGLAHGFIHDVVAGFLAKRRDLQLTIHARSTQLIADWLVNNKLDIGFANMPVDHPMLNGKVLARHRLVCLLPPGHRLGARDVIRAPDLVGEPVIAFAEGSTTRTRVDQAFAAAGVTIEPAIIATAAPTVCEFVVRGLGLALCAPVYAPGFLDRVIVRPFEPAISIELVMATPRNHRNAKLAAQFAAEAERLVNDRFPSV